MRRYHWPLFAVLSALLYSPAQYESFSMGFNLGWEICTAAIVVMVERLTSRSVSALVVAQAAAIALTASLTSGQGLLLWPIGLAIVAVRRLHAVAIAGWLALATVTCVLYFHDNASAALGPRPALSALAEYIIVFLGNGFAHRQGIGSSALFGAVIVVSALAALVVAMRTATSREETAALIPWAAFGAYAVLAAVATAATRAGLGVVEATSSRYSALSVFLVFALVGLLALVLAEVPSSRIRLGAGAVAAILTFGFVQSAVWGDATWRFWEARRGEAARRLAVGDFSETDRLYPDQVRFRMLFDEVCRVGDSPIRCFRSTIPAR